MQPSQLNIAVDGPAGAGKSTVAKRVAAELGLTYLDTGAMYRAVTWQAVKQGLDVNSETEMAKIAHSATFLWQEEAGAKLLLFNGQPLGPEIRSPRVTELVSQVASYASVRQHLRQQQLFLCAAPGVIMDGRDIGTVVMPEADLKIFLTASLEARAARRLQEQGQALTELATYMEDIKRRDVQDSTREHSPLRPAPDAVIVDTTDMALEEVVARVLQEAQLVSDRVRG